MGRKSIGKTALTAAQRRKRYKQGQKWARLTGVSPSGRPYKVKEVTDRENRVIGLDGESVETDGADRYTLLQASDGSLIENWIDGLSTRDCLKFLLELAQTHKSKLTRVWFIWFGMNYDVNQILKDVPLHLLKRLHERGTVQITWSRFQFLQVTFHPGKSFVVSLKQRRAGKRAKTLTCFNSQDVFGFSQTSFAKTLLGWQIVKPDDPAFLEMETMKTRRGSFASLQSEKVKEYNQYEVEKLAELGNRLLSTHATVGLELNSLHGAGATAGALLKSKNIKQHTMQAYPNRAVRDAVLGAYFGGHIQLHKQGWSGQTFDYDLRSAYPAAAVGLPSLNGAEWESTTEFNPNQWSVYHTRWDIPGGEKTIRRAGHALYPFPVRSKGHILWPARGEGWYWSQEVQAGLNAYPNWIDVLEGYQLVIQDPTKPFAFVPEWYRMRREYKAQGSLAQQVIKLGLNAMYGKLAQKPLRSDRDSGLKVSPYQSFVYAGLITAITRARLFEACMTNPQAVIMLATDGIFTDEPLPIQTGDELGDWELTSAGRGLFIQPGLYTVQQSDGTWRTKERGFRPAEIDWPAIRDNYPQPVYTFSTRRFLALGAALARYGGSVGEKWPGLWRQWPVANRSVNAMTPRWSPIVQRGEQWIMGYVSSDKPSEPYAVGELFEGDNLLALEYEELTSQPDLWVD